MRVCQAETLCHLPNVLRLCESERVIGARNFHADEAFRLPIISYFVFCLEISQEELDVGIGTLNLQVVNILQNP